MTYRVLLRALAEAGVISVRGSVSVVDVLPRTLHLAPLPPQFAPTMCVVLEQDEPAAVPVGDTMDVTVQVTDPDGQISFFARQDVPIAAQDPLTDPHRIQAVVPMPFRVGQPGRYICTLRLVIPTLAGPSETVEVQEHLDLLSA